MYSHVHREKHYTDIAVAMFMNSAHGFATKLCLAQSLHYLSRRLHSILDAGILITTAHFSLELYTDKRFEMSILG